MTPALAIHGGAGVISAEHFSPEREHDYRCTLVGIATSAWRLLEQGAAAVDVVEHAVCRLEDTPYFNAGKGAVLNADGEVEMDAAIMTGQRLCGGVAAVKTPRNPIRLARKVMEQTEHVLLAGASADRFATVCGIDIEQQHYFHTEERHNQLAAAAQSGRISLDHDEKYGTVGAVARDREGALAAASSTGGMTNKMPGRVGDTPLVGAGVWADNRVCAVSATGHGEYFMRAALAHDIYARMRYGGASLEAACELALLEVAEMGGSGGCIAIDAEGNISLTFNSPGMYRAWSDDDGEIQVAIFPEG